MSTFRIQPCDIGFIHPFMHLNVLLVWITSGVSIPLLFASSLDKEKKGKSPITIHSSTAYKMANSLELVSMIKD